MSTTDHKAAFLAAVKNYPAFIVAKVMTRLVVGVNYARCSKTDMAEAYSSAMGGSNQMGRGESIRSISLPAMTEACEAAECEHQKRRQQRVRQEELGKQYRAARVLKEHQRFADLQALRALMERENATAGAGGGAAGYLGDGRWDFTSKSVSVTPEELNALYRLAGVEPLGAPAPQS